MARPPYAEGERMPREAAFGFIVDDDGADKKAAGGALAFARDLPERGPDEGHLDRCPACRAAGEAYGCVGLLPTPISAAAERWLVERLPDDIESLPGFLLRKAIAEYGYTGEEGAKLRAAGLLAAPGPYTRHFGPFFRRFPVSSEQLLEEMLCAGDVSPAHGLAILVHLAAIHVDGGPPLAMEQGPVLGELLQDPAGRLARTRCVVEEEETEDESLAGMRRFVRALYAGFVVDAAVKVVAPEG